MKITFYGAAGEVTGSAFLLTDDNLNLLIDFGMFQGEKYADQKNYGPLPFDPAVLDAVLVTHAHFDHIGRIPRLTESERLRAPIYMTPPTAEIGELIWKDTAKVMKNNPRHFGRPPLYGGREIEAALAQVRTVGYGQAVRVKQAEIFFHDAGHILGSAFIEIRTPKGTIVFSGDLGNHPVPLHPWTEKLPAADTLVLESTYGDRVHEGEQERRDKIVKAVGNIVATRGTLLIPTFAIDRTQELIFEIVKLTAEKAIPPIPIFLDSPLAIKVTKVYDKYASYFNSEAKRLLSEHVHLFDMPNLIKTLKMPASMQIDAVAPPKIIIAGNGMMHGGRIMRHAERYLPLASTELLFVGYQAAGSLGRRLFNGERQVTIEGKPINVKATVAAIGAFSGHADQSELLYWVKSGAREPAEIYLVHGERETQLIFKKYLSGQLVSKIILPDPGQSFDLMSPGT